MNVIFAIAKNLHYTLDKSAKYLNINMNVIWTDMKYINQYIIF